MTGRDPRAAGTSLTRQPHRAIQTVGNYKLGKTLGEGTFGKVKVGIHTPTGEKVAIKILEKSRIKVADDVRRVTREIKILKETNSNRNVVRLYEVIDSPRTIYLITEIADGGELFDYIVSHRKIQEKKAKKLFLQLCHGMEYLHGMKVTHRDLKPENLLLQSSAQGWIIKIVDFGLSHRSDGSTQWPEGKDEYLKTACGSPCYAAPEMIAGKRYLGSKADIWSMGVILFAMCCGHLPFEDKDTSVLYKKILGGSYTLSPWLSEDVKDLLQRILNTDPSARLTIGEIKSHAWLKGEGKGAQLSAAVQAELEEETLRMMVGMGYNQQQALTAVKLNQHNCLTTTYHLLMKRGERENDRRILELARSPLPNAAATSPAPVHAPSCTISTISTAAASTISSITHGPATTGGATGAACSSTQQGEGIVERVKCAGLRTRPMTAAPKVGAAVSGGALHRPGPVVPTLPLERLYLTQGQGQSHGRGKGKVSEQVQKAIQRHRPNTARPASSVRPWRPHTARISHRTGCVSMSLTARARNKAGSSSGVPRVIQGVPCRAERVQAIQQAKAQIMREMKASGADERNYGTKLSCTAAPAADGWGKAFNTSRQAKSGVRPYHGKANANASKGRGGDRPLWGQGDSHQGQWYGVSITRAPIANATQGRFQHAKGAYTPHHNTAAATVPH
ncbi:unnamed protein product, partial [Chrysoparadoxa australica]